MADLYLINEAGQLVGRPIITACIDAYSGLCCGYSLGWEGGNFALSQGKDLYHDSQNKQDCPKQDKGICPETKVNPYKACIYGLCRDFLDGVGYDLGTK